MRPPALPAILLVLFPLGVWASAADKAVADAKAPVFNLSIEPAKPAASKFSDAQLAYVLSWIKQKAPECPLAAAPAVADQFLEDLQVRRPDRLEQLLTAEFPSGEFESLLLRLVGAKLNGAAQGSLREEIARRRVQAVLTREGGGSVVASGVAVGLIAKIQESSPTQYRRLVEGRLDEDELQLLLKKAGQSGAAPKPAVSAPAKVLTAVDIVSEFSRHNQTGSALQRLQALVVEGRLTTATGEQQELLLFKMRPDRFRLVVRSGGMTRYLLAADGSRFWQETPGQPPQGLTVEAMGSRRYLAEFVDPLFAGEGYEYARREDGETDGKKFHRVAVRRTDGSGFLACIDAETFRETARENDDHSVTRYSDFRDVAGVTYAFREEVTDQAGRKAVLVLTRITPNPGLIQELFEPPTSSDAGYFELERAAASAPKSAGKSF